MDINRWHLSLSHDGGIASAMVVAENERPVSAGAWRVTTCGRPSRR